MTAVAVLRRVDRRKNAHADPPSYPHKLSAFALFTIVQNGKRRQPAAEIIPNSGVSALIHYRECGMQRSYTVFQQIWKYPASKTPCPVFPIEPRNRGRSAN
jgi:hypothetical protein